jgi:DNA-binding response OmpR family regulator
VLQWKKSPLLLERTFLLAGRFSPLAGLKRSERRSEGADLGVDSRQSLFEGRCHFLAVTAAYRFGSFELQPDQRRLLVDGRRAALGPRAFDVLLVLVERAGQLCPRISCSTWSGPALSSKRTTCRFK